MAKRSVTQTDSLKRQTAVSRLDPLEKPHFFSGQLLTDQDLNRLLEWTERKFKLLNSKRLGWGIVEGLTVHRDRTKGDTVIITPGCAIDAQGQDILVNTETKFSLETFCFGDVEGCESLLKEDSDENQAVAIDLYLQHKLEPKGFQKGPGQDDCRAPSDCDYTYVCETFEIGPNGTSHSASSLDVWDKKFGELNAHLLHMEIDQTGRWKKELYRTLQKSTFEQFGFIKSLLDDLGELSDRTAVEIIFWMIQDARNQQLLEKQTPKQHGNGVPLARVWVKRGQKNRCEVIAIDMGEPWRRPYQPKNHSLTLDGHIYLGQYIWQSPFTAFTALKAQGCNVELVKIDRCPTTLSQLSEILLCSFKSKDSSEGSFNLFKRLDDDKPIQLVYMDTNMWKGLEACGLTFGKRIIGFCAPKSRAYPDQGSPPSTDPIDEGGGYPPVTPPPPVSPPYTDDPAPDPPVTNPDDKGGSPPPVTPPPLIPPPYAGNPAPPIDPTPPVKEPVDPPPADDSAPPTVAADEPPEPKSIGQVVKKVSDVVESMTESDLVQEVLEKYGSSILKGAVDFLQQEEEEKATHREDKLTDILYIGPAVADKLKEELNVFTIEAVGRLEDSELRKKIPGLNDDKLAKLRKSIAELLGT